MTAYLLTDHILNLMAPAAFVALVLVLLMRLFSAFSKSKRAVRLGLWTEVAIIFAVNIIVLIAALVILGNDGKMAAYAAMVLVAAICKWILERGWGRSR